MSEKPLDLEQIEKTIKDAEELLKTEVVGPALRVEDQSALANKYLIEIAKEAMARKTNQTIVQTIDETYMALYLATRIKTKNIEKAVERIANIINDLADRGLIHSTLGPISSLDFVKEFGVEPSSGVFAFVLVPEHEMDGIKKKYPGFTVEEGGMPESMEDIGLELADGDFLYEYRVSAAVVSGNGVSPKEWLDESINALLPLLPKGTVVKSVTECAMTGLSYDYEVIFHNPLMSRIKRIETSNRREITVVNGHVEQFNLFTGISYFDANGKNIEEKYNG